MPVHELGYRRWDGKRVALGWRAFVIASTGIRLAWRSHWLRRMLLVAWLPAISLGVVLFVYEQMVHNGRWGDAAMHLLSHSPYDHPLHKLLDAKPAEARHDVWSYILLALFRYPQGVVMVLLVGMLTPPLIANDLRTRAYLLYFSRPLSRWDYVLGKSFVVWTYLFLVTTLPALALYVLGVALSPDLSVVTYTWDIPLRVLGASVWLIVPTTALALCYSSMTSESRNASFAWFATWVLGWVAYSALTWMDLSQADPNAMNTLVENPSDPSPVLGGIATAFESRWTLVSLYHTLGSVQAWVFGLEESRKVLPAVGLLAILTFVSLAVLMRRVSAPLRI